MDLTLATVCEHGRHCPEAKAEVEDPELAQELPLGYVARGNCRTHSPTAGMAKEILFLDYDTTL
jgi:hypothetical protein